MNLDYIRSFHLIAQLRSVKDAAARMQLSQPALSHQLGMLEKAFAVRLIERNAKPLQLTEAGQVLLSRCQDLFDLIEDLTNQMKNTQLEVAGTLRIASPPGLGQSWLVPRLADFQLKYPALELQVELLDLSKVRDRLLQHRTDCVITVRTLNHPHFQFQPLFQEEMVLICDVRHRLAKKENWTLPNLTSASWIVFSEEDNSAQHWLEKRFGRKTQPVHAQVMINDHTSILRLLKRAQHLAILPRHQVELDLEKSSFVEILPSKEKALLNQVYVGYRARKNLPKKIQTLLTHLSKN